MGGRNRSPGWRDRAAVDLLLRHLPGLGLQGPVLVMGDPLPDVECALADMGLEVSGWNRRALGRGVATPWPPSGPFAWAALRLPRSKGELAMTLAGAAEALSPEGSILVYGAKDEGVGSAAKPMGEFFQAVETVGVGGHCRLLAGRGRVLPAEPKRALGGWREIHPMDADGLPDPWVSYPGVFAKGHLDPGTRLLLEALPPMASGCRILDYGCGSGVVGAVASGRYPGATIHCLDVDAVALEAARENFPQGIFILEDGLPSGEGSAFDAILTNPPFHRGKSEEPELIRALIREAPALLAEEGRLVLVAQKRLHLADALKRSFREVTQLADARGFRVWEGKKPLRPSTEESLAP